MRFSFLRLDQNQCTRISTKQTEFRQLNSFVCYDYHRFWARVKGHRKGSSAFKIIHLCWLWRQCKMCSRWHSAGFTLPSGGLQTISMLSNLEKIESMFYVQFQIGNTHKQKSKINWHMSKQYTQMVRNHKKWANTIQHSILYCWFTESIAIIFVTRCIIHITSHTHTTHTHCLFHNRITFTKRYYIFDYESNDVAKSLL